MKSIPSVDALSSELLEELSFPLPLFITTFELLLLPLLGLAQAKNPLESKAMSSPPYTFYKINFHIFLQGFY